MSAPRDKGTAAQQPQLLKTLENLLKRPENRVCVDCGTTAPRWASTNLGVFMCIRCSGIHRSLGVHISKVKSVSLDKWSPEQVEFMEQMGNAKANAIYEAYVPSTYHKGDIRTENMALEQWIRDKYERKRFMNANAAESAAPRHREHQREKEYNYREREPVREREPPREVPREREPPRERETIAPPHRPQARANAPLKVPIPATEAKAPTPAQPQQQAPDLLNWDAPMQQPPQPAAPEPEKEDFFGEFSGASATAGQPVKDKNSILQLYNTPIAPANAGYNPAMGPGMHAPQHQVYPGPNYNVHLPGNGIPGGYPYAPNYNMGRGGPMGPVYPMGPMMGVGPMGPMGPMGSGPMGPMGPMAPPSMAVPPGYFNRPAAPQPSYGNAAYPNYGPTAGAYQQNNFSATNPNSLVNGLSNLRM